MLRERSESVERRRQRERRHHTWGTRFPLVLTVLGVLLAGCATTVQDAGIEASPTIVVLGPVAGAVTPTQLDGQTVSGALRIVIEINERAVPEVGFRLEGPEVPGALEMVGPHEVLLDTTLLADRAHTIVATTAAGSKRVRELARATFTVANGDSATSPGPNEPGPTPEPGPAPDPEPLPVDGIVIHPGDDVHAVVRSHAGGSTFVFASGVHRLSRSISPRDGDVFVGQPGAVLSGARVLTSFAREGGLWVASAQEQGDWVHGSCVAEAPRCEHPEDLFLDDVPLRHVGSLGEVGPGSWFFDYAADKIYFADDPAGRVVEASIASGAIVGDADDVTVRGLVVEKFANQAQRGAIMAIRYAETETYGKRWVIERNTVRLNHGVGIKAGYGAHVVDNRVLQNGQLGIGGGRGPDTVVERNEIAYNNWAGFDWQWEAGGTKFVRSVGLVVRDNHVHHNEGPGLWTDIDNLHTLYEGNLVEHNANVGIFHEISYDAVIRNNTVRDNGVEAGLDGYAYVYGAGILVSTSSNVTVYGNVVTGNWNGIVGLHGDRGSGAHGVRELRNLHVHDNAVGMQFHADGIGPQGERGVAALTGVVQNAGIDFVFGDAYDNRFEGNRYTLSTLGERHFTWANARRDFGTWQGFEHDVTGAAQAEATLVLAGR